MNGARPATPRVPSRVPGAVPDYAGQIADRLRGPRALRRGMITELRAGYDDAVDEALADGLDHQAAKRRAARTLGDPRRVAAQLQQELGIAQARRTAVVFAVVLPALVLAWDAVTAAGAPAAPVVTALARLIDLIALGVVVGAVALLRGRIRHHAAAVSAATGGLALALVLGASVAMSAIGRAGMTPASVLFLSVGSVLGATVMAASALRSLHVSRALR